jgi:Glycopeptide antibiotics resistance protein
MRKIISGGLLTLYLLTLIWLVLFKLSFDIPSVFDYHHRSLNLIPFSAASIMNGSYRGITDNIIIFIPFGLLLNVYFKKVGFLPKFIFIMFCSLAFELIQFAFAIGSTDITDLIANAAGGLIGLKFYDFSIRYIKQKQLDAIIIAVGTLLLISLLYYRVFFLKIRY